MHVERPVEEICHKLMKETHWVPWSEAKYRLPMKLTGIYLIGLGKTNAIIPMLYFGKSKNVRRRLMQHLRGSRHISRRPWIDQFLSRTCHDDLYVKYVADTYHYETHTSYVKHLRQKHHASLTFNIVKKPEKKDQFARRLQMLITATT